VTLLATRTRNLADTSPKPAISARREDILKLTLDEYLDWVDPLRAAFLWAADFLADRHIFTDKFLPYPKQLVPLAVIKAIMGADADLLGPRERIIRWFWSGILGELYGLRSPGCRVTPNGAGCELRRVAPAFAAHSQCRSLQRHLRAPAHQ
jgi:hypothetical protein